MTTRIGVDFDNTIVIYDNVFYDYAVKIFNMPKKIPKNKVSIRSYFWNFPHGKNNWIELQGIVYGTKMAEASLAPGVKNFIKTCIKNNVHISIISHKTRYSKKEPKKNLHNSALKWMKKNNFFNASGLGLKRENIFFENLRKNKLDRIIKENCSIFIDDLPEIFAESKFPKGITKVLYDSRKIHSAANNVIKCSNWKEIENLVLYKNV